MAAAIESFSIREYVARFRSINMGKCCPFACLGRDLNGRSLPPILLRRFRWWADELECERNNLGPAPAPAPENTENKETCPAPARVLGSGKQKLPKKRSLRSSSLSRTTERRRR